MFYNVKKDLNGFNARKKRYLVKNTSKQNQHIAKGREQTTAYLEFDTGSIQLTQS